MVNYKKSKKGTHKVRCLRCQKMFQSRDRKTNRICNKCDLINSKVYGLKTLPIGRLDGRSLPPVDNE